MLGCILLLLPTPLISVAVIGFARSFYEIAEGSEGSIQVSLLLNGRQLQRTISVMVFSMDGTALGKYWPLGSKAVLAIIILRLYTLLAYSRSGNHYHQTLVIMHRYACIKRPSTYLISCDQQYNFLYRWNRLWKCFWYCGVLPKQNINCHHSRQRPSWLGGWATRDLLSPAGVDGKLFSDPLPFGGCSQHHQ